MEVRNPSEFDLLDQRLESLPDAGSERERRLHQAARCLSEFVGKDGRSLPADLKDLTLRLTRDALFDLYQGFRLGTFRGVSGIPRSPGEPPAAQIRLRERLEMLARVEDARDEMFRWFLAGLRHEIGHILRERLQSAPRTWDPRRLFTRWRGRAALALEKAFRAPVDDQNPEHEFGLYGLHLLFESTGKIAPQEFRALSDLMARWIEECFYYFPELEIRDLVRTMARASLSPEQTQELADRLLSWRDLERYPAERSFTSLRKEVQAKARAMGYGQAITALTVLLVSLFRLRSFPNPLGEEYQRYREEINRRQWLASALAGLALQDADYIPAVAGEIDALLGMDARVEARSVLMDALPALLTYPTHLTLLLETLSRHGLESFDEMDRDDLRDLHLRISQEALEALLNLLRRFPQVRWPLQILENAGALAPQAGEWLIWQLQDGEDDLPTQAAIVLHQRLSTPHRSLDRLENALLQCVRRSLKNGLPIPQGLMRWMLSLKSDEALRRLLLDLAQQNASLQVTPVLSSFLSALAVEVSHAEHPHLFKLAACWLVDPDDGLGTGLSLPKRLDQAVGILKRRQSEAEVIALLAQVIPRENPALTAPGSRKWGLLEQWAISTSPRLASVLLEGTSYWHKWPMYAGADRRLALVRALGRSQSPEHALPLLEELFQLAVEMYTAWYKVRNGIHYFPRLCSEAEALAAEILKATARLEPVLPQAVTLIEKILLAPYEMPVGLFSGPALSPNAVTREILPLLVKRRLTSEAVSALVELLEHEHPPGEKHAQRVWQIALQWLSNASDLSAEQQEVVWKVGYASPLILTRALALLVLGRQRPIPPRTWETVLNLLCTPWRRLYQNRGAEIARLSDRRDWHIIGPDDMFLVPGVAVALTAEWFDEKGLLTDEQKNIVRQAWLRASSDTNLHLEAHIGGSTHPLGGKESSIARGLAYTLCVAVKKSPDDDPDWLVRPADLARNLLLSLANHSQ